MEMESRPLASVCQVFADGDWIESKDQSEAGIRLVQTGNVGEGVFKDRAEKARYVSVETFQRLRCTELLPGDCLISRLPDPVGRACIIPDTGEPMITAVDCTIVRFREDVYLPKFFTYYSQSRRYLRAVDAETTGTTRKRISRARLGQVAVPVVPLPEQRRIVAILDEAFEAIATAKANTERNLQNAREVFESKLYALLDHDVAACPRKTLREIAVDFGRGKSKHRPRNDPKLYGGPYPFIQTGDVRGAEHLITEYTQSYSEAGLTQSKLWPKGTLCITIAANIAETGVLNFDACFPDSVIGVVVDEGQTSSKYLEYMLQTVKAHLKAKGKGSAQDNINLATFENERFPFPDLDTQARVVSLLDELSSRVQGFEELCSFKITALDELKRSLLHQAFSGLLTAKSTDQQLEAVA